MSTENNSPENINDGNVITPSTKVTPEIFNIIVATLAELKEV